MMWSLYEVEVKFEDGDVWYPHGPSRRDRDKALAERDRLAGLMPDAEWRLVEVRRKVIR